MLINIVLVAFGSAAGGVLRYLAACAARGFPAPLPYWTLAVNVIGGFVIGVGVSLVVDSERARLLLVTGFCGGFTTFSAFSLETLELATRGSTGLAIANIVLNVVLSIGACRLGMLAAGSAPAGS